MRVGANWLRAVQSEVGAEVHNVLAADVVEVARDLQVGQLAGDFHRCLILRDPAREVLGFGVGDA